MPRTSPLPPHRGAARYKRSETSRLLKGALDAGLQVTGLEIDPVSGTLRVLVDNSHAPPNNGASPSKDAGDAK